MHENYVLPRMDWLTVGVPDNYTRCIVHIDGQHLDEDALQVKAHGFNVSLAMTDLDLINLESLQRCAVSYICNCQNAL